MMNPTGMNCVGAWWPLIEEDAPKATTLPPQPWYPDPDFGDDWVDDSPPEPEFKVPGAGKENINGGKGPAPDSAGSIAAPNPYAGDSGSNPYGGGSRAGIAPQAQPQAQPQTVRPRPPAPVFEDSAPAEWPDAGTPPTTAAPDYGYQPGYGWNIPGMPGVYNGGRVHPWQAGDIPAVASSLRDSRQGGGAGVYNGGISESPQ